MVLPLIDFNCQNLRKFIYKLSEHATTVQLIEDDGAQGTGILHGQLQGGVSLFFAHVVTDYAATKGGALVWVKSMTCQLAACHPADGVDKVPTVQVFKPVLVRIMHIGTTVEFMS